MSASISMSLHNKKETVEASPNPDANNAVGTNDVDESEADAAPEGGKRWDRFAVLRMESKKREAQSAVAMPKLRDWEASWDAV
mmetsp:Transcript_33848/g.73245  ORF Transcript_33848/g.73245 Transcript_33848/m.73245 type:complete len:83 (-) Transcript_33848:908-1156(-)